MANTKVQSEQIEDGSITADKIADGAIVATELADNAVTTAKINADAVTGAKIADDAIDSEHYTDGSIDTAHIADAQITVAKMAANSVDSDQYVDGSIDTVHIGDAQVTTAKITDGNISTAKIADNAVTSAKIDTNIDIAGTFDVTGVTTLDSNATVAGNLVVGGTNVDAAGTVSLKSDGNIRAVGASSTAYDTLIGAISGVSNGFHIVQDTSDNQTYNFYTGSQQALTIDGSGIVINESSADKDFRVESNGNANMLVVNGGTDRVGIGTASPATPLHVLGNLQVNTTAVDGNEARFKVITGGAGDSCTVQLFKDNASTVGVYLNAGGTSWLNGGNVGIGTDSAAHNLHVVSSGNAEFEVERSSGAAVFTQAQSALGVTGTSSNHDFGLLTNGSVRMRINSSGVVGIGHSSPSDNSTSRLYIKGVEHVVSIRNESTSSAGERVSIDFLDHNGTRRGYISVDTSGTLYSTSSDYRLKNVIEPVTNGIERINKLNPVKFEWKDTGKEEEGFIAHEVDEIFGDAVGGKKDAVKEDGSIDAQTMDYGRITPLLVKAIQEQQEQIEQLKTEIEALKS